jgi:ubiquitin-activating enzyme E1
VGEPEGRYSSVEVLENLVVDCTIRPSSLPQVIVLTSSANQDEALRINNFTHDNKIAFIWANTNGLFGSVPLRLVFPFRLAAADATVSFALFSSVFNDFGPAFTCVDPTGENPLSGMIVEVENVSPRCSTRNMERELIQIDWTSSQDADAMVTCLDETRHGLEDGDWIAFSEIVGMDELNGAERQVSVKGEHLILILLIHLS